MSGAEAVGALDRPLYVAAKEVKRFLDEGVNPNWEILVMGHVIVGLFIFIGSVFLLNVLVAVLNIEYSKLSSSARWRSEQAAAILELQLWELLVDARAKWLYNGAGPQPYSPLQLGVAYDNPTMRWLLDVDERAAGRYWMHVMPPDDKVGRGGVREGSGHSGAGSRRPDPLPMRNFIH
eukprot:m.297831 g.297831  ORF g.297831 m.297831 type:complete len:178 (-) comp16287_c2_seq11:17-550(-)